jgi:CheY-like chemotaxis protein
LKAPATGYLVQPLRRATLVNQLISRDAESLSRASAGLRKLVSANRKVQKQSPLRILLVDDTPVNAMVATAMLGKAGHKFVTATNGRKALDVLAKDRKFDLVLLDLEMPEMDGYATAKAIRKIETECKLVALPILALTANGRAEDEARCLAAGMNGHLTKPFERQDLEEALHSLTKKKAA